MAMPCVHFMASAGHSLQACIRTVLKDCRHTMSTLSFFSRRNLHGHVGDPSLPACFSWAGWAGEVQWLLLEGKRKQPSEILNNDEYQKRKAIAVDIVHRLQNDSLVEWDELDVSSMSQRRRQCRLPGFDNEPPPPASNLAQISGRAYKPLWRCDWWSKRPIRSIQMSLTAKETYLSPLAGAHDLMV